MVATAVTNPVISAWSVASPIGSRRAEFAAGLRAGHDAAVRLDPATWRVPFDRAALVPGFDVRSVLGKRGTRSMDRASGLAVVATGRVLAGDGAERLPGLGDDIGLALGTSTGSAQSMMDFTRESLTGRRPYLVDPARFPNTVMNCAAGQTAIWHGLKGPNATIAGGRATGLLVLQYALRLHKAGRADTLLGGAVEEFSPARAWLAWHSGGSGDVVLGEGAAVWLLERAEAAADNGRPGIAEVVGTEFGFAGDVRQIRPVLTDVLRRLTDRAEIAPEQIRAVSDSRAPGSAGESERAAIADVLDGSEARRVPCAEFIGDTFAASAAFQIVSVLALVDGADRPGGCWALVTSVEANGVIGAVLLNVLDHHGTAR